MRRVTQPNPKLQWEEETCRAAARVWHAADFNEQSDYADCSEYNQATERQGTHFVDGFEIGSVSVTRLEHCDWCFTLRDR